ncbi:MAG: spore germination protein, partial [Clostridia bacterium]|nr:spore germination protein [Clostridia bacterium]
MKLFSSLNKNLKYLKTRLDSNDICFSEIKVGNKNGIIIFVSDLIDKHALGDLVIKPITSISKKNTTHALLCSVLSPEKQEIDDLDDAMNEVVSGNTLLIVDGIKQAFSFSLKKFEKRAIAEPPTSTVIKGPREGFVENLSVNISLIRRKLLTPDLKIEELSIGKYSKTKVSVCYIKGIADIKLVNIIKQKLKQIKIDAVLDSSYISKFLYEHKTSIFKQVGNTEKPDILTSKILEGRVAILVDGSPIVLTLPYLLLEDFQSPSDYYGSSYSAIMARILRVFAVVISLFLPAMFLSAELLHLQLIPLSFLHVMMLKSKGFAITVFSLILNAFAITVSSHKTIGLREGQSVDRPHIKPNK